MKNIKYCSRELSDFYSKNRNSFSGFYPSEKWVFDKVFKSNGSFGKILDVGCACGGLSAALNEKYDFKSYTGIDISKASIESAKRIVKLKLPTKFIAGDIVLQKNQKNKYDTVFSLSCADWNVQTNKIFNVSWNALKPGGFMMISLRLTDGKGINNIRKSYQYINMSGRDKNPEIANYVVFSLKDAVELFSSQRPSPESIGAYGYWGKPSKTAVTPYKRLVFAVFYIKKSKDSGIKSIRTEFNLPSDIY
jgi:SAM-dependent methyltransferase